MTSFPQDARSLSVSTLLRAMLEPNTSTPSDPEFWGEVQPPASLKGLDIPSRRAVFVPWKPSRRPAFGMGSRLFVEEPMLSTGLHFASESTLGNLARFVLLPGQRHDSIGVEPLITGVEFGALLADKAFDNDALRATLDERGAVAVIPAKT